MLNYYHNKHAITNAFKGDIVKEFVRVMSKSGAEPNQIADKLYKKYWRRGDVRGILREIQKEEEDAKTRMMANKGTTDN